jgi:hypothetical protein
MSNTDYTYFYKLLEDPTCLKYYYEIIHYYKSKNKLDFANAFEKLAEKIRKNE